MKVKKIVMLIFAIIFFVLFIIFLLPVAVAGIINIGNITGALTTGILTAVFLFWDKFRSLFSGWWGNSKSRIAIIIICGIFFLFIIAASVISFFMIREINDKPKDNNTTLVVLGCQVRGNQPSLMLKCRLDSAYDYLSEHEEVSVIVSGGQGPDEAVSEAECMYDYLVSRGIDEERIYIEDKSTDTNENIKFSKNIIEQNGLCSDITIVTDGFHQFRADIFAKRQNLRAYNISARTQLWLVPTYWVREWFGVAYYTIFK